MIGAGASANGNLDVGFNRVNNVAQYEAGNDVLVANVTSGRGDTDNNLINRMYGVTESYNNIDDHGFLNMIDLSSGPNSDSFVTGFLERLGGDTTGIRNGNISTPGAGDPMNPKKFCNLGPTGHRKT
jgi:hypothetical protein